MNSKVFFGFSYGVYIVSAFDGTRPTGCVANSAMQITSSPPTVAISINHDNFTNACIQESGKFALSVLAQDSDPTLIGTFGFKSGKNSDKFQGVSSVTKEGLPIVTDACGYIVCRVIDKMETPTHTVFLGEVIDGDVFREGAEPMTYAYYHKVIKGKSPKNAPTYLPEEKQLSTTATWVCGVCGYVYEGDPLPKGFVCPVCGQGEEVFKKVEK